MTLKMSSLVAALTFCLLIGCSGVQRENTSAPTDRWGNSCPQWQSHANCMKNH